VTEQRASWIATAVFAVSATLGVAVDIMEVPALVVALVLFIGGMAAMFAALVIAAGRSRTKNISVGGLFFLAESAPRDVQVQLLGSLAAQCLIGIVTAAVGAAKEPRSPSAFGVLAPIAGLGLAGLWAARHGNFADRLDPSAQQ